MQNSKNESWGAVTDAIATSSERRPSPPVERDKDHAVQFETITKFSFAASLPPSESAIKIHGQGGGMRIILDIPESELGAALNLLRFRETALKVTIEKLTRFGGYSES